MTWRRGLEAGANGRTHIQRDARNPRTVDYLAAPPGTWNIHLQTHDDLLLVINAKDMFAAAEFADEHAYYRGQLGTVVGTAQATTVTRRVAVPVPLMVVLGVVAVTAGVNVILPAG